MVNANWLNTPGGLIVPPERRGPSSEDVRQQAVLREALGIFHSAVDEFRESAELKENIGGYGNGATLGAQSWNLESQFGEKGFSSGAAEEVLRSLSEYLTTIQGGFYGSQYGYGYGTGSLQVGDVVKADQLAHLGVPRVQPRHQADDRGARPVCVRAGV